MVENRDELVWGLVRRDNGQFVECRCYRTQCSLFRSCRPDYPADSPEILPPERLPSCDHGEPNEEQTLPIVDLDLISRYEDKLSDGLSGDAIIIDFEDEPEIIPPIFEWKLPSSDPSPAVDRQEVIIRSLPHEYMLVQAGPGTGKTHSLLRKLEYMVDENRMVEADSVLLLCFTRAAVSEIKDRFKAGVDSGKYSDDLSRLEIRTFDSFATRVLIARNIDLTGKDYNSRIEMAIQEIQADPEIIGEMRHLIVDEIQDLVGIRARLVQAILSCKPPDCGFTLLGDSLQGIYDYQIKDCPGEPGATDLLEWIMSNFPDRLGVVTLDRNFRQNGELASFMAKSRMLLEGGTERAVRTFIRSVEELKCCGKDYNFPLPLENHKKIGILCRTNGEALKISNYFRQRGVDHVLRRHQDSPELPPWIAEVLSAGEVHLTREQFINIVTSLDLRHPMDNEKLYSVLHSVGDQNTPRVLNLNGLKRALALGARLPDELYEERRCHIFLSTIHQSKGREFEEVFLLSPRLNEKDQIMEEAKVLYVAVTRARQSLEIIKRSFSREWLTKSETVDRWLEVANKRGGGKTLVSLEVGREQDVDNQGFVDGLLVSNPEENQIYLRMHVVPGDRVEIRMGEEMDFYGIYHKRRLIGRMSMKFHLEVGEIMKEVYGSSSHRPMAFEEIYIDQVHSVVKKPETLRKTVPEPYFTSGVWHGVSLSGLAKVFWPWDCRR
ncbi:MAG: ATP-dependent helicase [Syntrophomonadaceae bacterium]|nr:ATP-dependent helicase [Syntrophomonadaceae bacterium]